MSHKVAGGRVKRRVDSSRAALDTYHTPFGATKCLLRNESFDGRIIEPACGAGYIVYALGHAGYVVQPSDIRKDESIMTGAAQADFFDFGYPVPNIVTNPPFCIAAEFIEHGHTLFEHKMALLLRLSFLESEKRYDLWQRFPPAKIIVLSKRLPYQEPNGTWNRAGGQFCHAWFIWNRISTETRLIWAMPDMDIFPPGLSVPINQRVNEKGLFE